MSDTIYFLQIPGSQLESIEQDGNEATLHFSQVHLVQEMEGAIEDSLWTQAVKLTIKGAGIEGILDSPFHFLNQVDLGKVQGGFIVVLFNRLQLCTGDLQKVNCIAHGCLPVNPLSLRERVGERG